MPTYARMETSLTQHAESALDAQIADEVAQFHRDGYFILRNFAPEALRKRMIEVTLEGVRRLIPPLEFEADLHYPGAPNSLDSPGGTTVRRLKQALFRDHVFVQWLNHEPLKARLGQLLGPNYLCPTAHHNCIMTKEPRFSSDTGWHQDIRYWSFSRPELVNVWLALGSERPENGCLQVIPGSHRATYQRHQFDDDLFFRRDLVDNEPLLSQARHVVLNPGDVLLFHARTLHAASRNFTQETKYSVVFTFRPADNPPQRDSRSYSSPEVVFH